MTSGIDSVSDTPAKKKADDGTAATNGDNTNKTGVQRHTTDGHDHPDTAGHDDTSGNKLEQQGVTDAWSPSAIWGDVKGAFNSLFGSEKKADSAIKVDDISTVSFDNIFDKTVSTKDATAGTKPDAATKDAADKTALSGLGSWFDSMGKSITDAGGSVVSSAKSGLDWLFSSTDSNGDKKTISAHDGTAHFDGKDKNGKPVDVSIDKNVIDGIVGDAKYHQDKATKETDYQSTDGHYHVQKGPNGEVVTDNRTGQVFNWDAKEKHGYISDKSGNHILDFTSEQDLKQQLGKGQGELTQTNHPADQTADHIAANGKPTETQYVVDNHGNYAVVRPDGTVIKTYKDERAVTISRDGHTIKIQGHHVYDLEDGKWVEKQGMNGWHGHCPRGVDVSTDGQVSVDGKKMVDAQGDVQADDKTKISTSAGKMTTGSNTGPVTVDNDGGKTTVDHPGVGTIVNDGQKFTNTDPSTQNIFKDWDPGTGQMHVFTNPNGSGVELDGQGHMTVQEDSGQRSIFGDDGSFAAYDPYGQCLMNEDPYGDLSFWDGTTVGADGYVSNSDGSGGGYAWDDGSSETVADTAISSASGALGTALTAAGSFSPEQGAAALPGISGALTSIGDAMYRCSAVGNLSDYAELSSMYGNLLAAQNSINANISAAGQQRSITGDADPSVTKKIIESGLTPETYLRLQQERNGAASSQGDANSTAA